jgi:hypothetical protein
MQLEPRTQSKYGRCVDGRTRRDTLCVQRVELRRPRVAGRTRRNPHGCGLAYAASSASTLFSLRLNKKGKERTEKGISGASGRCVGYPGRGHRRILDALDAATQVNDFRRLHAYDLGTRSYACRRASAPHDRGGAFQAMQLHHGSACCRPATRGVRKFDGQVRSSARQWNGRTTGSQNLRA